jgi:cysteine desulfurase
MTNLKKPIYLDYAASTPVDKKVAEKMFHSLSMEAGTFGNPSSNHSFGISAKQLIEAARESIATLLHATSRQIIFTSGATESNNLAIKGIAKYYQNRGKHIVTSLSEHKSVLESCMDLEQQGFNITYLKPKANGLLDLNELETALRKDTILVSLMHVNNETGVIQDIARIGALTRRLGIFFHVDAVQSVGKIPLDVEQDCIDLLSISAHKIYGPKGIGVLYVGDNPRVRLVPLMQGGGQERKFRAGTLPTHQIIGMAEAFKIAEESRVIELNRIKNLRDRFWNGIQDLPGVYLNNTAEVSLPHILNIRFEEIMKEPFLATLQDLAISSASACNTINIEPSHVLLAMGLSSELAHRSFRFSFGRYTTQSEIEFAVELIREKYLQGRNK